MNIPHLTIRDCSLITSLRLFSYHFLQTGKTCFNRYKIGLGEVMAQISIGAPLSAEVNVSSINTHHHGNLWDDYFIQSLRSPYEAPECHERCEKMIEEVKHLLLSHLLLSEMRDGNVDLIKRLQMVDIFECLGIDRHFHHEIQAALDYVYRLNVYTHVK